jgi:membrane protein implicated in regulation of membrane protease activity
VAAEKLGQAPPSNRQLLLLRFMGVIAPPPSAGIARRVGGILLIILLVIAVLALGWAIVQLVALPFGGLDPAISIFWGLLLVLIALGVLFLVGRRRQSRARARAAEQRANAMGTGRAARRSRGGSS